MPIRLLALLVLALAPAAGRDPVAILERAAAFQGGEALDGPPRSLHGRFYVTVVTPEGRHKVEVERWYTRDPQRMRTSRVEEVTGLRTTVGYDGETLWFRDDGSGEVTIYSDRPDVHEVDIALFEEQLRLTALVLDSLVLRTVIERLEDPAWMGEAVHEDLDGARHVVDQVAAMLPDETGLFPLPPGAPPPLPGDPAPRMLLVLEVDRETGALWSLTARSEHEEVPSSLRLEFDLHGPTVTGLRVPGNIEVYANGSEDYDAKLGVFAVEGDEHLHAMTVDAPIDDAVFAAPGD